MGSASPGKEVLQEKNNCERFDDHAMKATARSRR